MKTIFATSDLSDKIEQKINSTADLNSKLVAQMHAGVAHFHFVKKDGSIREAYGTLSKPLLEAILGPQEDVQQGEPVTDSSATIQKFYDLQAQAFRSFSVQSLIAMF